MLTTLKVEATVDFVLKRPQIKDDLMEFLRNKIESNIVKLEDEAALDIE
jgi:hypothetical protein